MITLSAFGLEKELINPANFFSTTWKTKSFINGESVSKFEKEFKDYCNAPDCVAVSSCTSALQLSLLALNVVPGDEVITVPYTWISTVEAIKQVGATPIFVDINPDDLCMDPKDISNKITSRTKAIITVDLYGNVSDIDSLMEHNIPIIEDAAQSTGAMYKGKRVGGMPHLTCFSFYPTKNLGSWGDAGAVTGMPEYTEVIRELRNHGQSEKFKVNRVGWNARMDSIQAEVLVNKLPLLDTHNKRRREIASMYDEALRDVVRVPVQNQHSLHVYHQYVIQSEHTKRIKDVLASKNIQSRTYYPTPINELEPYRTNETFPNSQRAGTHGLAIPVHQYLTDKEIELIIDTIKEAL